MAAKHADYESAAALRGTKETPTLNSAPSKVTRAEYDAVLEYAYALEAENTELKSGGGDNMTTISNLEAASATTKTGTNNIARILAEMRTVHAAQIQEITAIVAAATTINAPAPALREGKA